MSSGTVMDDSESTHNVMEITSRRPNSNVVRLSNGQRLGHLVAIQYLTYTIEDDDSGGEKRVIDETFLYNSIAAFLGYKHFNERRGDIWPQLPQLLEGCDFYWTYEFRDSQWNGLEAARQLAMATGQLLTTTEQQKKKKEEQSIQTEQATDTHAQSPSGQPTESPSGQPTDDPTTSPSQQPTSEQPSSVPTRHPTISIPETHSPSLSPSHALHYDSQATTSQQPTDTPPRTVPPRTDPPLRTLPPRTSNTQQLQEAYSNPTRGGGSRTRKRTRALQQSTTNTSTASTPTLQQLPQLDPFALFGAYWSSVSKPLSTLSGALEIPQVSGASTSAALEDNLFFARTVATNDGDAHAAILYYQSIGVTHLSCLYIRDSWGVSYHASLKRYARDYGIQLYSYPYDRCCAQPIVANLAAAQPGHVFCILHNWKEVLGFAHDEGIIGHANVAWMAAEEKKWTGSAFSIDRSSSDNKNDNSDKLAQALHGIGTLNIYFELVPAFEEALEEMAFNPQLQQEYIDIQGDPTIFEGYEFPRYAPTGFTNSIFDAMMALGLTACNVSADTSSSNNNTPPDLPPLFTGPEFYQKLVETTNFEGVSGHVTLDPRTGTRQQAGMRYSVEYLVLSDERTTEDAYRFESKLAAVMGGNQVDHRAPFVYYDNTTTVPASLPPPAQVNLHLLPKTAQAVGYALGGFVMAASLGFLVWTIRQRNVFVVRASQPIFLGQLCVGTLIMALYVFPASLPPASTSMGPDRTMDIACMAQLWVSFLGFVTAFSAVFAKTYRLNQLMNSGRGMRRIRVDAKDVMWPFALLTVINVTMLLCVTFAAPFRYHRVEMDSYDQYGRSIESYGTCRPDNYWFFLFCGIMFSANTIGVLVALYQAWKARNLPTEFSESYYLALSLASFTETLFLGGPILIVVYSHPTTWYLMSSLVLCVGCMTILLPLMLPKYYSRNYVGSSFAAVGEAVGRRRGGNISGLDIGVDGNGSFNSMSGLGDFSSTLGRGMMSVRRRPSWNSAAGSTRRKRHSELAASRRRSSAASRRRSSRFMGRIGGGSANSYSGWFSGSGDSTNKLPFGEQDGDASATPANGTGADVVVAAEKRRLTLQESIRQFQQLEGVQMSDSSEEEDGGNCQDEKG